MSFVRNMIDRHPVFIINCLKLLSALPLMNNTKRKGKGNKIYNHGLLKHCKIRIIGKRNKIIIGDFTRLINTKITILGDDNVVDLSSFVYMQDGDIYIEDSKGKIQIGEHTTFSGRTHLACIEARTISIGERCLFSSNVTLRTGDSHSILDMQGNRTNASQDIRISNRVWIGNSVIILKGVNIAEDSIVATGSLVTKTFKQPNVILGGVPAKIIKENIKWLVDRIPLDITTKEE